MSRRVLLLGLLGLALAARVGFSLRYTQPNPDGSVPNIDEYHALAMSLVEHHALLREGQPTSRREPLYPIVLAALYLVTGPSMAAVVGLNILFGLAIVWLTFRLGEELFSPRVAALAGAMAALHPQLLYYTTKPQREIFQTLLLTGAAALALDVLRRPRAAWALAAGAAGGLVALTNSALLPGAGTLVFAVWLVGRRQGRDLLKPAALMLAAFAAIYSAWPIRNALVYHRLVVGMSGGGCHIYLGFIVPDEASGLPEAFAYEQADPDYRAAGNLPDEERDAACYKASARWIKAHPGGFLVRLWQSLIKMWRFYPYPRDYGMNYALIKWVSLLSDGWIIPLGLLGMIWTRRRTETWVLDISTLTTIAVYCVFWAIIRYRIPLMPVVFLYAGYALARLSGSETASGPASAPTKA